MDYCVPCFAFYWHIQFFTSLHTSWKRIPASRFLRSLAGRSTGGCQTVAPSPGSYRLPLHPGITRRRCLPTGSSPGRHVKKNRRVELTINSLLPRQVAVPSLVGFSLRQAKAELAAIGLKPGRLIYTPDLATNNVMQQLYQGQPIAPGAPINIYSAIDLVLGMAPGHELAYIPMLFGKSLEAALDILSDHSLNTGIITYDQSVLTAADTLAARVFRQSPDYSQHPEWPLGTAVHLTLTINPDLLIPRQIPLTEDDL